MQVILETSLWVPVFLELLDSVWGELSHSIGGAERYSIENSAVF